MSVLDLSGADTSGFDPIDPGKYNVRVAKVELASTGPNSKVPGTPLVKIQLKVLDGDFEGRTVFDQFTLPNPAEADDATKAQKTLGFFVRFLTALGYDEAKIKKGGFKMDNLDDLIDRRAVATVRKVPAVLDDDGAEKYAPKNEVTGYKPEGDSSGTASNLI